MTTEIEFKDPRTQRRKKVELKPYEEIFIGDTHVKDYDTYTIISGANNDYYHVENEILDEKRTKELGLMFLEHWTE